jgi:amino acid transporter
VLAVSILYVLIQLVVISVDPAIGSSKTPLVDVAEILMGPAGATLMAAGAVFSISGNVSATMLSGPRMLYAMGHGRVLPQWFGRVHSRFGTPANAILSMSALGLVLALSGSFVWLAAMSTVVRLLVYAAGIAALPRLHRARDSDLIPFNLPGGYTIPVIALLLTCWSPRPLPSPGW